MRVASLSKRRLQVIAGPKGIHGCSYARKRACGSLANSLWAEPELSEVLVGSDQRVEKLLRRPDKSAIVWFQSSMMYSQCDLAILSGEGVADNKSRHKSRPCRARRKPLVL